MSYGTMEKLAAHPHRPTAATTRRIFLTLAILFSGYAWGAEPLYDTHSQVLPDNAKGEDCKALNDELSRIAKFARNPAATKKQLEANKARATKLEARSVDAKCPAKVKS